MTIMGGVQHPLYVVDIFHYLIWNYYCRSLPYNINISPSSKTRTWESWSVRNLRRLHATLKFRWDPWSKIVAKPIPILGDTKHGGSLCIRYKFSCSLIHSQSTQLCCIPSITFHLAIKLAAKMKLSPFYALLTGYVVLAQCNKTS